MRPRTQAPPFVAAALLMILFTATAWAETVYVTATTAQLRAGKTSLDAVVANLKYGQALDVVTREDRWLQVRTDTGVKGWIFYNKVSGTKPTGGDSGLAALGQRFRKGDSSVTASAGARGLDKASESYANRTGITQQDRDAVDRMTAYKIPDDEIQEFLKSGRLGEYAE